MRSVRLIIFSTFLVITVRMMVPTCMSCCYGSTRENDIITDTSKNQGYIKKEQLNDALENSLTLIYKTKEYTIEVEGEKIVNPNNELRTDLNLKKEDYGYSFEINNSMPLPGPVRIRWAKNIQNKYDNYYIKSRGSKELTSIDISRGESVAEVTVAGKYIICSKERAQKHYEGKLIAVLGSLCVIALLIYFAFNKRYWLW